MQIENTIDEIQQSYELGNENGYKIEYEAGMTSVKQKSMAGQLLSTFLPSFVPTQAQ